MVYDICKVYGGVRFPMDPSPNPNHPATPHQVDDIVVELGRRDADAHDLCV